VCPLSVCFEDDCTSWFYDSVRFMSSYLLFIYLLFRSLLLQGIFYIYLSLFIQSYMIFFLFLLIYIHCWFAHVNCCIYVVSPSNILAQEFSWFGSRPLKGLTRLFWLPCYVPPLVLHLDTLIFPFCWGNKGPEGSKLVAERGFPQALPEFFFCPSVERSVFGRGTLVWGDCIAWNYPRRRYIG